MVSLLPHPASFRFRLAADTLAFGCILPATGRIRVLHPLETCAAGRTYKPKLPFPSGSFFYWLFLAFLFISSIFSFRGIGAQ